MRKKNQTSHTNRYILLGLSLFCALMMVLSSFSDKAAGPFKVLANVTVIPLQQGINYIGGWLGDMKDNFSTMEQLRAENESLQEQVDALTTENNYLQEESYEYERLQELYELDQNYAEYEKTAAHVIGKDSGNWFNTFTIDKGSNDGIEVDMNVLAGSGLAGIVTEVGPTWAKVRSIIDDSTNVSGMVLSTSDTCIVSGDLSLMSSGQIAFDQMENNDNVVSVGDQIVTSYISDKYLQGILIGSISEINVDSNNLTRSGYITPAVDFKNIQEVLVITTTKAELTGENDTGE
ncbi:rod shape-determining protein MreC [Mediterraneibacter catenae]|jgi:rod shape-determining protein MreC|uniref:Cell shape-determining protein MreC n=1 Tax=Mediterraneibacter catenae TaxID=2594882 RepID=A0A5M9I2V4_9FIRM|nr:MULTISPECIES: rod shape-determining protein MreC [Mediterraneibacter]OUO30682.1 rod shape-determining protein MreC [Lachnoclostridium sp. An298]HJA19750.1 rod shape-determining protein MreC [Candidatus Mediterraneibacter ornithocaccae]KAA8501642.1 rod shape-determining protein MreC [Mediterraneibacter catenae]MCF2568815.1 rod shape-determining protein MreC [Mediterraneibacter glycyrrhizinilyticus]MDN0043888.1 rod shape-determining protein MreC [Mediterraneibacter glycyrrhizinilyticus]